MARLKKLCHCRAMQHSLSAGSTSLYALLYSHLFQIMRFKLAAACQWSFLLSVLASPLWRSPINTRRSLWKLLWLLVLTILLRSVITRYLSKNLTNWLIGDIHPLSLCLLRNHNQGIIGYMYNCHCANCTIASKNTVICLHFMCTLRVLTTVFIDSWLWKTEHPRKRFQNFHQSYVLSTDQIEIHQSQPQVWPSDLLYIMLLMEILETFLWVFCFPQLCINKNSAKSP